MDRAKLGASTACLANTSLREALAKIRDLGFRCVELLAFDGARHSIGNLAGFWFNRMGEDERRALRRALEGFAHVATHLPFIDVPLFSHNPEIADFCRKHLKMSIEGSAYFGAEVAAVHVYPRTGFRFEEYWGEMIGAFRELGDFAAKVGVRLGIETGAPARVGEYTQLIRDIDHPFVGGLVDVGHCFFYADVVRKPEERGTVEAVQRGNDCVMEIVQALGAKAVHVHLHDVRQKDWRDHRAVGRGVVDFRRLFATLREMKYGGLLTFELEEPDQEEALAASKRAIEALM